MLNFIKNVKDNVVSAASTHNLLLGSTFALTTSMTFAGMYVKGADFTSPFVYSMYGLNASLITVPTIALAYGATWGCKKLYNLFRDKEEDKEDEEDEDEEDEDYVYEKEYEPREEYDPNYKGLYPQVGVQPYKPAKELERISNLGARHIARPYFGEGGGLQIPEFHEDPFYKKFIDNSEESTIGKRVRAFRNFLKGSVTSEQLFGDHHNPQASRTELQEPLQRQACVTELPSVPTLDLERHPEPEPVVVQPPARARRRGGIISKRELRGIGIIK